MLHTLEIADECYFFQLVCILPLEMRAFLISFLLVDHVKLYYHQAVLTSFMVLAIRHEGSKHTRYLWNRANFIRTYLLTYKYLLPYLRTYLLASLFTLLTYVLTVLTHTILHVYSHAVLQS